MTRYFDPLTHNGRWVGRWIEEAAIAVERGAIWVQKGAAWLRWRRW
jgi:hypothetical protein